MSEALDGNSIGGLLIDVFGADMTAASSTCGTCGAVRPVAELVVYRRAPGTVVRCRTCGNILMVFVQAHGVTCVDLAGLASMSRTEPALSAECGPQQINMPNERSICLTSKQKGTRKDEYSEPTVHAGAVRTASHVDAGAAR